jgi:hypothetical protein
MFKKPAEDEDDLGAVESLFSAGKGVSPADEAAPDIEPASDEGGEKDPAALLAKVRAELDELELLLAK